MGGGSIGKWKITSYEACYDGRVTSCKSEGEGAAEVDADDGVEGRDGVSGEEGEDVGAEEALERRAEEGEKEVKELPIQSVS